MKRRPRLKKNTLNFFVDTAAALTFVGLTFTGYIIRFILPAGSGRGSLLWGNDRHDWGDIHAWFSYGMFGLILIHLALHWKWITGTLRNRLRRLNEHAQPAFRTISALAALLLLVFLTMLYAAHQSVKLTDPTEPNTPTPQQKHLRLGPQNDHPNPMESPKNQLFP